MSRFFFLVFFILLGAGTCSGGELTETEKLATLCKVWGFLKYHHLAVMKGRYDWDRELLQKMEALPAIHDRHQLSDMYISWINELGGVGGRQNRLAQMPPEARKNLNADWIADSAYFTDSLTRLLQNIQEHRRGRKNHYVHANLDRKFVFTNEKDYADSIFPSEELRLLCLLRYWNAVDYYYPCKYANDKHWDDVLVELIPRFASASNETEYCYAMMEMIADINDSHAWLQTPDIFRQLGKERLPAFRYSIIEGKLVITGTYNDSLALMDRLRTGDVIESVDGQSMGSKIAVAERYISASTEQAKLSRLPVLADSIPLSKAIFERNGGRYETTLHRYKYSQLDLRKQIKTDYPENDSVHYLNLWAATLKQIRHLRKTTREKKFLVIDARDGGNNNSRKLARRLLSQRHAFVRFSSIDPRLPGITRFNETHVAGKKNSRHFKGKVILLFNEHTQSAGEYACMMLRKAPNVTCIGTNTAAADGPVSYVSLPGGYRTGFSSKGVYEPDGTSLVRIGLTPDIPVEQTIDGVRMGRDEILDRANVYIRTRR